MEAVDAFCFQYASTCYAQDFDGAGSAHVTQWRSTSQKPSAGCFGAWSSRRRRGLGYDRSGPFTQPALALYSQTRPDAGRVAEGSKRTLMGTRSEHVDTSDTP